MAKKPAAKKPPAVVPVDTITHGAASRKNIPTAETAAFGDGTIGSAIHERDAALDPQLVWKGKAEQDAKAFEVPVLPIHVQEKVHPRAIIEDLKARAAAGGGRASPVDLFSDFNGLDDFAKKLDFYHHDEDWTNRLVLGYSLLVMASLSV